MVMIYLGEKHSTPYSNYYFYNSETNYIYVIYDLNSVPVSGGKWHHCCGSNVERLSRKEREYPFNEWRLNSKLKNTSISNYDGGFDIYYQLEKIIDKIIFDDISW
jgi:hypothetical protein